MSISALETRYKQAIIDVIDQKTKPIGALGQLEQLALQLALIQSNKQQSLVSRISINQPTALVFAGDHGISEEGVSIAPSAVTRQMVLNFLNGGAAINCFCRANNISLTVIDAGIIEPITVADIANAAEQQTSSTSFIEQRLGAGSNNFATMPAMSIEQVNQGIAYGEQIANQYINQGCNLLILGEMGIANTSSATALLAAVSKAEVEQCVGFGTGINSQQLIQKTQLIKKALLRVQTTDAISILSEVGGFEIVQMVGAILAAAKAKITVLIDGFIVSCAALMAKQIDGNVTGYLVFAHQSEESGHQLLLSQFNATPLINLGLRLGEGTGAALALPLLTACAHFYNDMASFSDAGISV
ncbi:nicotinate-nucleotide--dimethylbenzimidazole phosphoribosyltransferase [Thalassotalea sp. ND16A]|uniref:nicotinate-nucleotide--dimethylbenzimidazole phosphoribosyltransferase n=1 Tax=Thalassotalea sp. ND16A TaxID=1535422 RepID=UPI00051A06AD|nr:nicotinate-nucleotide--dimethylbenzimidazole phosphoribosyltransferase [Thalassotalea sp. ND16A]KGJ99022.1 Nicotinate-nucleotide--dimethylbenzimidazole phosphoribosyltransferase [Thalassotalea sp. ND16A]